VAPSVGDYTGGTLCPGAERSKEEAKDLLKYGRAKKKRSRSRKVTTLILCCEPHCETRSFDVQEREKKREDHGNPIKDELKKKRPMFRVERMGRV